MENTTDRTTNLPQQGGPVKYCTICGACLDMQVEICPHCGVRQMPPPSSPLYFTQGGAAGDAGTRRAMNFGEALKSCLGKSFDWKGRASRSEYIYGKLGLIGIGFALQFIGKDLASVYSIAALFPAVSLEVRRLHDLNRSGWLYFFYTVACFFLCVSVFLHAIKGYSGWDYVFGFEAILQFAFGLVMAVIVLMTIPLSLYLIFAKGTAGANRYGE